VAANSRLRAAALEQAAGFADLRVIVPAVRLCTDNAAMIAVAGTHALERGLRADDRLNADPGWRLT
jgi:N6-L-threonylcarbamoyladenine synthase